MERIPEPQIPITLTADTVNQLMAQTDLLLSQEGTSENQQTALQNLKAALEAVLPFVPEPLHQQPDEITMENDIREEIVIAGANENG